MGYFEPGVVVGRYRLVQLLGQGGMGQVFRARDPELDRDVALKVLTRHDRNMSARVEREGRALARLSHPNVVSIYDVGHTRGRAFIAMELVEGPTLGQWLRAADREVEEVLDVFVAAGRGLAAAHRCGLVHRDYKPGNVLLGPDGRARVTDFGLARNGTPSAESTVHWDESNDSLTVEGTVVGTPPYMAPEQHTDGEIDERSDQFAFCVALYEAIVGRRPYHARDLRGLAGLKHAHRPEWPRVIPAWLKPIIERGLSPSPQQRYPSMDELLTAIGSRRRRSRRAWMLGGVPLALAATATAWAALPPPQECDASGLEDWEDADRQALLSRLAEIDVRYAADTAQRVGESLDAWADDWRDARAVTCDTGAEVARSRQQHCLERARTSFSVALDVLHTSDAGTLEAAHFVVRRLPDPSRCVSLGKAPAAPPAEDMTRVAAVERELSRAVALGNAGRRDEAAQVARTARDAAQDIGYAPLEGNADLIAGRIAFASGAAEEAAEALHGAYETLHAEGDDAGAAAAASALVHAVGVGGGRVEEGRRWGETARALLEANDLGPGAEADLEAALADLERYDGNTDANARHSRRALELTEEAFGDDHPATATAAMNYANAVGDSGDFDEALRLHRNALALGESLLGPTHPDVGLSLANLGAALLEAGRHRESIDALQRSIGLLEGLPGHQEALGITETLIASALRSRGAPEIALPHLRRGIALMAEVHGAEHPRVGGVTINLGNLLSVLGRREEADREYVRALRILRTGLGPEHPNVASALSARAILLYEMGDGESAIAMLREALAIMEKSLGAEHPIAARARSNLGGMLVQMLRAEEGIVELRRAEALRRAALGDDHPALGTTIANLGDALMELSRVDEAEAAYEDARRIALLHFDARHDHAVHAELGLLRVAAARGEAEPVQTRAESMHTQLQDMSDSLADTLLTFAEAQAALAQGDRRGARRLGEAARDAFAAQGPAMQPQHDRMTTWLDGI